MRPTAAQLLRSAGVRALLVTDLTNIRYLAGVDMSAGSLLVSSRGYELFADGRYEDMARQQSYEDVSVLPAKDWPVRAKKLRECAVESETVTIQNFLSLKRKYKSTKFVHKSDIVAAFRRQKDASEIRLFKRAQRITQELLERVRKKLKPGVTEREIALQLFVWAIELGAEALAFEPIVAFGTHTCRPHHEPTTRRLLRGHIVQIDVGARYEGYCADQSRVFFTVPKTPAQARVYKALQEAKDETTKLVKAGATNHELDVAARSILEGYKLNKYFTHSLGHGVGLNIHEGVNLSQHAPLQILQKGEIITIEPGVYLPGKFGMRLEDEVIVL